MSNGRDNYSWNEDEKRKERQKKAIELQIHTLAQGLQVLEGDSRKASEWIWILDNYDKIVRNRKLIELLG